MLIKLLISVFFNLGFLFCRKNTTILDQCWKGIGINLILHSSFVITHLSGAHSSLAGTWTGVLLSVCARVHVLQNLIRVASTCPLDFTIPGGRRCHWGGYQANTEPLCSLVLKPVVRLHLQPTFSIHFLPLFQWIWCIFKEIHGYSMLTYAWIWFEISHSQEIAWKRREAKKCSFIFCVKNTTWETNTRIYYT